MRPFRRSLMFVMVLLASTVLLAPTGSGRRRDEVPAGTSQPGDPQRSAPKASNQIDQLRFLGLRAPLLD
jgi:hypothetical protein